MDTLPLADAQETQDRPDSIEPVAAENARPGGRVIVVRGAVLDVAFDDGVWPSINESLEVISDQGPPIIAEVQAHLDQVTVRALAYTIAGHELHHRKILQEKYFEGRS